VHDAGDEGYHSQEDVEEELGGADAAFYRNWRDGSVSLWLSFSWILCLKKEATSSPPKRHHLSNSAGRWYRGTVRHRLWRKGEGWGGVWREHRNDVPGIGGNMKAMKPRNKLDNKLESDMLKSSSIVVLLCWKAKFRSGGRERRR
jgi:hypothetical protein